MAMVITSKLRRVLARIVRDTQHMRPDDHLAQRARLAARIARFAEGGQVAIVAGGRDCDGVVYEGHVSLIPASVVAYERHVDRALEWADGPMHFDIELPSVAEHVEPYSRDLGAEAHENGHPHVLRY